MLNRGPVPSASALPARAVANSGVPAAASAATPSVAPSAIPTLLNDASGLALLLVEAVEGRCWLDAYLFAAGLEQIAADRLHPELPAATEVFNAASLAGSRRAMLWAGRVTVLVDRLADTVAGPALAGDRHGGLILESRSLARELDGLPDEFRRDVVRLPAAFHRLDQEPSDLARLIDGFASRWPDRERPLLAVGVRTSGSYLAPLQAAFLRAAGYRNVRVLTVRPGRGLLGPELDLVRSLAETGGLALLSDAPPITGRSIAGAAEQLIGAGLPAESAVLLLQVFAGEPLPPILCRFHTVLLPWRLWAVNQRLRPEQVEQVASNLLGPDSSVVSATPVPVPKAGPARGHAQARYRLRVREQGGPERDQEIVVEGVGLGYFGAPARAAVAAPAANGPTILGLENGLLYRESRPEGAAMSADGHSPAVSEYQDGFNGLS